MKALWLLAIAGTLCAQTIGTRIDRLLARSPAARQSFWGIRVVDAVSGRVVYSRNANQFFIPASNTKLFTTALALMRLGPDHRFRTSITAPAMIDAAGGVSELRFVGGGDPNLSGRTLPYQPQSEPGPPLRYVEEFAQKLFDMGLRSVDGDIIGDDSAYAPEPYPSGWALDDPIYSYGAPVSALFLNDAMFRLTIMPTITGQPPMIECLPVVEGLVIHNRAVTGSTDDLKIERLPGSFELTVSGTVQSPETEYLGMEDPALVAAASLRQALLKRGVRVGGEARVEHTPAPGITLLTHESLPLLEDLRVINKESQNLHAEVALLEVGRVTRGSGTRKAGLEEMDEFLIEVGIEKGQYHLKDGSGLSRQTLLTAETITKLLVYMYNTQHRDAWISTLPIGRLDGTLKDRFGGAKAASRVLAKTGSIAHVNALSGYVGRYAFSILVNNANLPARPVRQVIDQIALALTR